MKTEKILFIVLVKVHLQATFSGFLLKSDENFKDFSKNLPKQYILAKFKQSQNYV